MWAAEAALVPAQVFVGRVGDGQRHSALVSCTSETDTAFMRNSSSAAFNGNTLSIPPVRQMTSQSYRLVVLWRKSSETDIPPPDLGQDGAVSPPAHGAVGDNSGELTPQAKTLGVSAHRRRLHGLRHPWVCRRSHVT